MRDLLRSAVTPAVTALSASFYAAPAAWGDSGADPFAKGPRIDNSLFDAGALCHRFCGPAVSADGGGFHSSASRCAYRSNWTFMPDARFLVSRPSDLWAGLGLCGAQNVCYSRDGRTGQLAGVVCRAAKFSSGHDGGTDRVLVSSRFAADRAFGVSS
jgi:hypothetical protein